MTLSSGRTPSRIAFASWASVHLPMPVSLSGVMLAAYALNGGSSNRNPPERPRLRSNWPLSSRATWQLPQATAPSIRYFPRSISASRADTGVAGSAAMQTSQAAMRFMLIDPLSVLLSSRFHVDAVQAPRTEPEALLDRLVLEGRQPVGVVDRPERAETAKAERRAIDRRRDDHPVSARIGHADRHLVAVDRAQGEHHRGSRRDAGG